MRRVVCAACINSLTGDMILGARHFDNLMRQSIKALAKDNCCEKGWSDSQQGFIDQNGIFINRREAWKIAKEANQTLYNVGGDQKDFGTLYSENLY